MSASLRTQYSTKSEHIITLTLFFHSPTSTICGRPNTISTENPYSRSRWFRQSRMRLIAASSPHRFGFWSFTLVPPICQPVPLSPFFISFFIVLDPPCYPILCWHSSCYLPKPRLLWLCTMVNARHGMERYGGNMTAAQQTCIASAHQSINLDGGQAGDEKCLAVGDLRCNGTGETPRWGGRAEKRNWGEWMEEWIER